MTLDRVTWERFIKTSEECTRNIHQFSLLTMTCITSIVCRVRLDVKFRVSITVIRMLSYGQDLNAPFTKKSSRFILKNYELTYINDYIIRAGKLQARCRNSSVKSTTSEENIFAFPSNLNETSLPFHRYATLNFESYTLLATPFSPLSTFIFA